MRASLASAFGASVVAAAVLFATPEPAAADDDHGFGRGRSVAVQFGIGGYGYGGSYFGGHGQHGHGHYGHDHYGHGHWGGYGYRPRSYFRQPHPHWHDTTHWDYEPGYVVPHGNHLDYIPGRYHLHRDGHWDLHH